MVTQEDIEDIAGFILAMFGVGMFCYMVYLSLHTECVMWMGVCV